MDKALERHLQELLGLVEKHSLAELRIEGNGLKVRLCKAKPSNPAGHGAAANPGPARSASVGRPATAKRDVKHVEYSRDYFRELRSPIVGVFYRGASPQGTPFVEVGDYVHMGQVVCLIEAMKVFNEICAERPGRVVEILAGNGDIVEDDQVLMLLDESAAEPRDE